MSQSEINTLVELVDMLRSFGCDINHQTKGNKVRFIDRTGKVKMSMWMTVPEARIWANGYLIGTGHKKGKK